LDTLPDGLSNAPAVHGFEKDRLEDQEVQRPLDQIGGFTHICSPQLSRVVRTAAPVNSQGKSLFVRFCSCGQPRQGTQGQPSVSMGADEVVGGR
jgi:hypothetical protein